MVNSFERGKALLDALGSPARRPTRQPRVASNGRCWRCDHLVVWADAPSGSRVPLDVHPAGELVIRDNVAVERPATDGERRYVLHFQSCREALAKEKKK